jgi:hypothetical protein
VSRGVSQRHRHRMRRRHVLDERCVGVQQLHCGPRLCVCSHGGDVGRGHAMRCRHVLDGWRCAVHAVSRWPLWGVECVAVVELLWTMQRWLRMCGGVSVSNAVHRCVCAWPLQQWWSGHVSAMPCWPLRVKC